MNVCKTDTKLDKVGPVDSRPSTDKLHRLPEKRKEKRRRKKKKNYMWRLTYDTWHMTCDML